MILTSLFIICKSTKLFSEVTFFYTKILNDKLKFENSYSIEMYIESIIIPFTSFYAS